MSPDIADREIDREKLEIEREQARRGIRGRWANPGFRFGVLAVLAILIVAGVFAYLHYSVRVSTDDAQVDGDVTPIACKVYGTVIGVQVRDNQQVKEGQVLVRIDPRDYQVKVDQEKAALALAENQAHAASLGVPLMQETTSSGTASAQAQLGAAEAELTRSRRSYQQGATAELQFAQANVASAQASYEKAQADLERMKPLVAKAEISQQQYDAFLAAARVAEAQLAAAKDRLNAAQHDIDMRKAAVAAAEARVRQAQAGLKASEANAQQVPISSAQARSAVSSVDKARANVAAAELQLGYTTIVSPTDGVVTRKTVEPGQIVQAGQSLMVVVPLHRVWVTANFKETQLSGVHPGQKAEINVDMYGGRKFPGRVDSIAGATGSRLSLLPPENATGNFVKVVQRIPVKIVLDPVEDPSYILRPGMNVVATIITK